MRIACVALFLTFTWAYLYFYQADILTATQHLLSDGKTHYDRTIGAVLITLALYVLHLAVLALTKITRRAHAVTYFPSLLALAVLTGIRVHADGTFDFGFWPWLSAVLLAIFVGVAFFLYKVSLLEKHIKVKVKPVRLLWGNLLLMCLMFLFVGLTANHDDVFHYRMKMENCMLQRDYRGALEAGRRSLATDSALTRLRIHALVKSGRLGEQLFEYPLVGGSAVMMPTAGRPASVFYPASRFVRFPAREFNLCQYLLDCNLDAFVRELAKDSVLVDSARLDTLPKHYREALVLYNHLRSAPLITFHHDVMDADYADFQKLARSEADRQLRMTKLRDIYGTTYWYYYATRR